jgi:uncharacterized protein
MLDCEFQVDANNVSRNLILNSRYKEKPLTSLLVKLASRCNLKCTYCYWFRDESVYSKPKVLTMEAQNALMSKLETHIKKFNLSNFTISFHGGEPLLFNKKRFAGLCAEITELGTKLNCRFNLCLTTNGLLFDSEWISIFEEFHISIALSIDSTAESHDARRIDARGVGSFSRVEKALRQLQSSKVAFQVLSVCDVSQHPQAIFDHLVERLGVKRFDILIPDHTRDDVFPSISGHYQSLFDLWFDVYSQKGVEVRILSNFAKVVMGFQSKSEAIGYGQSKICTLMTDGTLEAHDALRIAGRGHSSSKIDVFENELQDIEEDPLWMEVLDSTRNLPKECESCVFKDACGGGFIANRWSNKNRYNNPSAYCSDLKAILNHVTEKIARTIEVEE